MLALLNLIRCTSAHFHRSAISTAVYFRVAHKNHHSGQHPSQSSAEHCRACTEAVSTAACTKAALGNIIGPVPDRIFAYSNSNGTYSRHYGNPSHVTQCR